VRWAALIYYSATPNQRKRIYSNKNFSPSLPSIYSATHPHLPPLCRNFPLEPFSPPFSQRAGRWSPTDRRRQKFGGRVFFFFFTPATLLPTIFASCYSPLRGRLQSFGRDYSRIAPSRLIGGQAFMGLAKSDGFVSRLSPTLGKSFQTFS